MATEDFKPLLRKARAVAAGWIETTYKPNVVASYSVALGKEQTSNGAGSFYPVLVRVYFLDPTQPQQRAKRIGWVNDKD
jgi:hypothetical protein